jgi:hypothetical protein
MSTVVALFCLLHNDLRAHIQVFLIEEVDYALTLLPWHDQRNKFWQCGRNTAQSGFCRSIARPVAQVPGAGAFLWTQGHT